MKTLFQIVRWLILAVALYTAKAQEVSIPDQVLNAAIRRELRKPSGPLTAQDMLGLTNLHATGWCAQFDHAFPPGCIAWETVKSLEGLGAAHNLAVLDLSGNELTNLTLPPGLTNLTTLKVGAWFNYYAHISAYNFLTNLTLPEGLTRLTELDLQNNRLTSFTLPATLTNLVSLNLDANPLTNLAFPPELKTLTTLDVGFTPLTDFPFLGGLPNLTNLNLSGDPLTSLSSLRALTNLTTLDLRSDYALTNLTVPAGLTNLTTINLDASWPNTFVLPELLATNSLAGTVSLLKSRGASIYTYPLGTGLTLASFQRTGAGNFGFALAGPAAAYAVFSSSDLTTWKQVGTVTNTLGAVVFSDLEATASPRRFYRASSISP